jgi:hypothetical protein
VGILIEQLAKFFADHDYKWRIGGVLKVPDEIEIEAMLDKCAEDLYDGAVGDRITVGRLIVEKQTKTHDVYVYTGSYQ